METEQLCVELELIKEKQQIVVAQERFVEVVCRIIKPIEDAKTQKLKFWVAQSQPSTFTTRQALTEGCWRGWCDGVGTVSL